MRQFEPSSDCFGLVKNPCGEDFANACIKIIGEEREKRGIGTLSERTLHSVLKNYFEPDETRQEVPIGGFVADIVNENGIVEIQTGSFDAMRKKLSFVLEAAKVTMVYPIAEVKRLYWVDTENGAVSGGKKSPKRGKIEDAFLELYKIKSFLKHENLNFCFVLLDLQEYRLLSGWSKDKKKGSRRKDRTPLAILGEVYVENLSDYKQFLPLSLPEEFTVKDYKTAAKVSPKTAGVALNVLLEVGAVKRVGKKGNAFIYERA